MSNSKVGIKQRIDSDKGLQSKRRLLVITSLILLVISLSGAKVLEANTFILKITFENQGALASILFLSVVFLFIRYYSYAKPYYDLLYNEWSSRMLNNSFFLEQCPYSGDLRGLLLDILPESIPEQEVVYGDKELTYKYICRAPLRRSVEFTWNDEYGKNIKVYPLLPEVGFKKYLFTLWLESKYSFASIIEHRETLDIYAPYSIAVFAIICYLFPNYISSLFVYLGL